MKKQPETFHKIKSRDEMPYFCGIPLINVGYGETPKGFSNPEQPISNPIERDINKKK